MNFDFTLSPSEKDISAIYNGLVAFNKPNFPDLDEQSFGLFVRDKSNNTVGGLTGQILFTSLHIKFLWLSESIRGNGIGSELLKRVEKEAVNCCVANIYLDTFTFQAPKFYERLGYIEVGRYTDFPLSGVDKVFYQKRIGSS